MFRPIKLVLTESRRMEESRNITFPRSELLKAIDYFRRRNQIAGVSSRTKNIDFEVQNGVVVTKIALVDGGGSAGTLIIDHVEMLAAIISYCLYMSIRIPQMGQRTIAVVDGELTLVITGIGVNA